MRVVFIVMLWALLSGLAGADSEPGKAAVKASMREGAAMKKATGTFEVKLQPQANLDSEAGAALARLSLDKQFVGDLVGVGRGEMLSAVTSTKGSAGYVAIERFNGTVHGRKGSFVFQHSGQMNRGAQQLAISVVPDSGVDELLGITGVFKINIVDGKHFYEFEYSLP
jgi:hypothetical protein